MLTYSQHEAYWCDEAGRFYNKWGQPLPLPLSPGLLSVATLPPDGSWRPPAHELTILVKP
jgi:hypothetical protein